MKSDTADARCGCNASASSGNSTSAADYTLVLNADRTGDAVVMAFARQVTQAASGGNALAGQPSW